MNTHVIAAVAEEHRADLLRAAGCCTALHTQRRVLPRVLRRRLTLRLRRGSASQPMLCCTCGPPGSAVKVPLTTTLAGRDTCRLGERF